MHTLRPRRTTALAGVALFAVTTVAAPIASAAVVDSARVQACEDDPDAARVKAGADAGEPTAYKDAEKYGVIKDSPRLDNGSVDVETIFHVVTAEPLTPAEVTRMETMIAAQMEVLNDSFDGTTASDASNTTFRFTLSDTPGEASDAWVAFRAGGNG